MPKKTRKEKIIAELRRKLQSTQVPVEKPFKREEVVSALVVQTTPVNQVLTTSVQDISLVLKDLRKTFFLAGLAISFEIIVYLLWH